MSRPLPPSQRRFWTTNGLLHWTTQHFEKKGLDHPRRRAEMLLGHVLEVDRLRLYMEPDRPASELERAAFRDLVERASAFEPVEYLVGQGPFMSMLFKVSPATLIPRPSTETLVEHVIQHSRATPGFRKPLIADIGTGSGCIAVTLAKYIPDSQVIATDISEAALDIARENAKTHGVAERIDFRLGSLFEPLDRHRFHYLCSNPPYIPDVEWPDVGPMVKDYEPTTALRGGAEGLDIIQPLIEGAADYLADPGQLVVEIAAVQKAAVIAMVNASKRLTNPHVLPDHEHLPRILIADTAS